MNGHAAQAGDVLRVTDGGDWETGSAFDNTPISLQGSFATHFEVDLYGGSSPPADGITLTIQSSGVTALGTYGGSLGYAGVAPSLAVELDTYYNTGVDPDANHVAILENGVMDDLAPADPPFNLYGAGPVDVWVDYDASALVLTVFVGDHGAAQPTSPLISFPVNLVSLVGFSGYLGFTGATGSDSSVQDIVNWEASATRGCIVQRLGNGDPAHVVVLAEGLNSSLDPGAYLPLEIPSYCSSAGPNGTRAFAGPTNSPLNEILSDYDDPGSAYPNRSTVLLTDALAQQGAVLLPFSYQGARLEGGPADPGSATFSVKAYKSADPGAGTSYRYSATLETELASIHSVWPESQIMIVAHSEGGLVAEQWWVYDAEGHWVTAHRPNDHDGVTSVTTLDSPINGLSDPTWILKIAASRMGVTDTLIADWNNRWNDWQADDKQIGRLEGKTQVRLTTIGTAWDLVYALGDYFGGPRVPPLSNHSHVGGDGADGLVSQLVFDPSHPAGCASVGASKFCQPLTPPSGTSDCNAPARVMKPGTTSIDLSTHGYVKNCGETVNYLSCLISRNDCAIPSNSDPYAPYGDRNPYLQIIVLLA